MLIWSRRIQGGGDGINHTGGHNNSNSEKGVLVCLSDGATEAGVGNVLRFMNNVHG